MGGKRTWRRLALPVVTGVLLAGLAWGLADALASSSAPSSTAGKVVLRVGWTAEPDNLNPFVGWASASYEVWALNYDQLVGWSQNVTPIPTDLATSWDLSPDGKTYTFHLREGVKWQDGQPFSADDVAFTYNYIIKHHMYAFAIATAGLKEARVVDPSTVELVCSKPKADLLWDWVPILPEHIWKNVSPQTAGNSFANKPPIVGTGPFQCVQFKKGDYVTMEANKDFWGGAPKIDEIVFQAYQNADTMTTDLKLGAIDAAQGVPEAQFDSLGHTSGLQAVAYNFRNWDYLNMNCYQGPGSLGNPVLRDMKFRQALNWAIDRQKLADVAWGGRADAGTTILPPDNWFDPDWHWQPSPDDLYTYDPAKAEAALDAAGYKDTNGDGIRDFKGKPIDLRLWAPNDSTEEQAEAKLVAGELQKVGLKIRLEILDSGALTDRIWNYAGNAYAPDFDLYVWGWDGYSDPGQTLSCFTSDQIENLNEPCWSNAEFDKLCQQQFVTTDPKARQQIIWHMQQIMYEETPQIVLTYPQYLQAYSTARWTEWTRVLNGKGPAFMVCLPSSYLNLRPVANAPSGGSPSSWVPIAAPVIVVVLIVVAWLVVRLTRRREAVER